MASALPITCVLVATLLQPMGGLAAEGLSLGNRGRCLAGLSDRMALPLFYDVILLHKVGGF